MTNARNSKGTRGTLALLLLAAGTLVLAQPAQEAAAQARKIVALADTGQNLIIEGLNTQRSISFYDVTDISGSDVFNQTPLFSVWLGYEIGPGGTPANNFEEVGATTVNPISGDVYVAAFDSPFAAWGTYTPGDPDNNGDGQADMDLYRIRYQSILDDFITNNRPAGTMYAPTVGPDGSMNIDHPKHVGTTVHVANLIEKIGEVARGGQQISGLGAPPTFDHDIEFRTPASLIMLDNQNGTDAIGEDTLANDHEIRVLNRVSTSNGAATYNVGTNEGGFDNQTTESWESKIAALVNMDDTGRSEPTDIIYFRKDGAEGVWVVENDAGGDEVGWFNLNFGTMTAAKGELQVGPGNPYPSSFIMDEDPIANANSNDGDIDWLRTDANGNLVIGETGFLGAANPNSQEARVITREVLNYNDPDTDSSSINEVVVGGWDISDFLPAPTADDDTGVGEVTDSRFAAYDRAANLVYFFDVDSGSAPNVSVDVYVFDPVTGEFVYEEQNAINPNFTSAKAIEFFTRGDVTDDGVVDAADIDELYARTADPTMGGFVTAAVGEEWNDLTGDQNLSAVPDDGGDMDELVRGILGTNYGDTDLDGEVDGLNFLGDFAALETNYNGPGGWADGNYDGQGDVDEDDLALFNSNFVLGNVNYDNQVNIFDIGTISDNWLQGGPRGDANASGLVDIFDVGEVSDHWLDFEPAGGPQSVPEPSTWVLALVGLAASGLVARRRSRRS